MRSNMKNMIAKRIISSTLAIMMVLSLIPTSTLTAFAATNAHPNAVTITVTDENGDALSGASVSYTIDSSQKGNGYMTRTILTDNNGTVEVLNSADYISNDMTITATVSKSGYTSDTSISGRSIVSGNQDIPVRIRSTSIIGVTVTAAVVPYDGNNHDAATVSGTKSGDIVSYQLGNAAWSNSVPQIKEVGTYSLKVKVERNGYADYEKTVVPEVKKGKLEVTVTPLEKDYDGKASNAVSVSGIKSGDTVTYELKDGTKSSTVPMVTDVGTYEVTVTVHRNDNYEDFSGTYTAVVNATSIKGLSAILYSGTYDGQAHDAVIKVNGTKPGDTIQYQLGDGAWSENVPSVTDAGTYEVKIQVVRQNYETTKIDLNPATVVIEKADQKLEFNVKRTESESSISLDEDPLKNVYDFSAKGGNVSSPKITYSVVNDTDSDSANIADIAEIDSNGKLTVKQAGYNIKVIATVAGDDNYKDKSIAYGLTIVNNDVSDLLTLENKEVNYVLGTSNTVTDQQASKIHDDDNGTLTYKAAFNNGVTLSLNEAGLSINKNDGKITISDYAKLASAMEANGYLSVEITVNKSAGTKESEWSKKTKIVYGECAISYTTNIRFGSTPSDTYTMQDPDGNVLTAPNGTIDTTWFNTAVTVLPADTQYSIAKDTPVSFDASAVFDNQGTAVRKIYLKNKTTGEISAPITVDIDKIDSIAPDSNLISIEYSESVLSKIFWFFNPNVTITVSGYDPTSGIDHFKWSYTRSDDASESNLDADSGELDATAVEGEDGKYTAQFTLPRNQAEQLKGYITVNATDKAGLTSEDKKDDGRVIVVDTISPTRTVSYELETVGGTQQIVDNRHYYSDNVKFTFDITEANFFGEDVDIKVSKDGGAAESKQVTWAATTAQDQQEATLVLKESGDYVVSMTYKDRSGNEMPAYESDVITIDKDKPVITFAYSNGNNTSATSDDPQKATITINEHNFRASDVKLTTTAVDIKGGIVSVNDFEAYLQKEDSWSKSGDTYTATISDDFADAIYTMTINYSDLALNAADEVKSGEFIVDHTAPAIDDITYSAPITETIISAITFGYYNPDVTVTFTAKDNTSGIDYFTWSYKKEAGASNTNVEKYESTELKSVQDSTDKSKFTASVTLPKNEAEQLRGNIAYTATDYYSNTSDKLTDNGEVIVVDTIAPTMTAEFTSSSRTVGSKMYYNKDFKASFIVTEANFYAEDVKVEVSKNGGSFKEVSPTWTDQSTDIHVGTYKIAAPSNHNGDGEYVFRAFYTDRSNNKMKTYTSDTIVIDTIKPIISVSYSNNSPKNTLKDSEGHNRDYFDSTQTATVTITEHNFAADEVNFNIAAKDVSGKTLGASSLNSKSEWTESGDKHTITITYPGDANYTFDVGYADLATNKADDYAKDYFTVDKTAPTRLTVSYSSGVLDTVLSGISFGFYSAKMTVTISAIDNISGVHSFAYSYLKATGVSGVNAELVNQAIRETGISFSNGGATGTAKFEIPKAALGNNNQFNGTVKFTANDRSKNKSNEFSDTKRIVVDNIAPTSSVEYNAPVQTVGGIAYYDGNVNATVTINEANFYAEDVKVSVTKDGASYAVTPKWSNNSTDVHVGSFALTDDGDYFITISYTDKSTNQMVTYTSDQLTVDTEIVEPIITVNGEEANGKAFKDDVIPAVSFEDINFESYETKLTRTRYNSKDEDVTEKFIGANVKTTDQGGSGAFDTFTKEQDIDGIYTLTVSMTDKAGHSSESSSTFTVNRFGSVYVYDDYLISLIENGGAYTQAVEGDLIVTEYNADKLLSGSLDVEVSRDGKPLDDVDFVTTPEINDNVAVGSSGWYQYQYTIDKENFAADGVYKAAISSKDATGNSPETTNYEEQDILFRVDSTAPEINSITGLEESIINAQDVNVKYNVYDTIGLASIKVFVDEKEVDSITDFATDLNNYEGSFDLSENSAVQTVKLIVTDLAGNVTDTSTEEFKAACAYTFNEAVIVSTNPFVRALAWIKAHIGAVIGAIAGIAAVVGFIIFLLNRRKKMMKIRRQNNN